MVKLERGSTPKIWTKAKVQEWTERWEKKLAKESKDKEAARQTTAQWTWYRVDGEQINHIATKSLNEWHYYKCAFCEIQNADNLQIEHFYPKSSYPKQAFEWPNLFLICSRCNLIKGVQDPDIGIKPDIDDPSEYLWFSPALQRIIPKPGISIEVKRRAEKTIELYGLDRMGPQYQLYWHKITLQSHPINLAQVSTSSASNDWDTIHKYIHDNYPAVEARAKSTEEFSLMVRSVIKEYIPATRADQL